MGSSLVMAQIAIRSPLKDLVSFTLAMSALDYLVAAPWIPPSTITRVMHNAPFVVGEYHMNWRQVAGATVLALFLAPACWLLGKLNVSLETALSFFFSLFCPALVVGCERFGMALMPQPHRYHLELDLPLCLLGISLLPSISRFAKPNKLFPWLLLPFAIFLVIQTRRVQRITRKATGRSMSRPQLSTRFRLGFVITSEIEESSSRAQRSSGSTPEPGPQEIVRRPWYHGCFGSGWWGPADDHKIRTGAAR